MQGAIQKWVDHSISVTVNLPNDVSEDMVGHLYVTAWDSGCKGATVYRDGSRSGVLVASEKKSDKKDNEYSFPKRPKLLEAEVVRFQNNNEKWIAFVGILDNRPYEIFTGMVDEDVLAIPKSITKGKIIKTRDDRGKTRYDFQYTDKYGYQNTIGGLSHMFKKEFWNYAKLISGILRHGMPLKNVVDLISKLQLDSESINSWKTGVERALKKFIPDGTKAADGQKCSQCESENLVYQEGCLICTECGHSKCG